MKYIIHKRWCCKQHLNWWICPSNYSWVWTITYFPGLLSKHFQFLIMSPALLTPTWYNSSNSLQTYNSKLYTIDSSISIQSTNSLNNVPASVRWNHQEERRPRATMKWNGTPNSSSYLYISYSSFWSQKLHRILAFVLHFLYSRKEAFNVFL